MKLSMEQLFQRFLFECEFVRKVQSETLRGYKEVFRLFTKLLPGTTLAEVNTNLVIRFFEILEKRERMVGKGLIKTGIKKSTIATYRSKLNSFFDWLIINNHLKTNPFDPLPFPHVEYSDKQFIKKGDVEKIFSAIQAHHYNNLLILKRNILAFHFLLFCGLRKQELVKLQIRDVDLEKKLLTVRAETSKSKRMRQLPLHSEIVFRIKDYYNERKDYKSQYLFVSSQKDREFSSDGLKNLVIKLSQVSGVKFHLHQFRHTFAINYLKQSSNIFKLKELLGHKNIAQTATYLRHLPVDELRPEIESMSIDNLI